MHWFAESVLLKHQHARPFGELRVVLNDNSGGQAVDNLVNQDLVGCQLFVPVCRHLHLAPHRQGAHLLQRLTHSFEPSAMVSLGVLRYSYPATFQMSCARP